MSLGVQIAVFVVQVLLLGSVIAFLAQCFARLWSGNLAVPYVPTPHVYLRTVAVALELQRGDMVYELGSGDGRLLIHCSRLLPEAHYIGIERNYILHSIARFRKLLAGNSTNISLIRGNFYDTDFSQTNKIYGYLLPSAMRDLFPTLIQNFHGRFVSRAFIFPSKKPTHIIELSKHPGLHGEHLLYVYDF